MNRDAVYRVLGVGMGMVVLQYIPTLSLLGSLGVGVSAVSFGILTFGCYYRYSRTVYAVILQKVIKMALGGFSLLHPCSWYIPTLVAGWYIKEDRWYIKSLIPVLCMGLFWAHPVGSQAWYYALYWLIPVVLCRFGSYRFAIGLSITFVQHAVGSVIWLYSMSTTPELWHSLMGIIFYERLLLAVGMSSIWYLIDHKESIYAHLVDGFVRMRTLRKA